MNIETVLFFGITQLLVVSRSAKVDGRCNDTSTFQHVSCTPSEECFLYSPETLHVKKRAIPDNPGDEATTPPAYLVDGSGEGTPLFPDSSDDSTKSIPVNHGSRRRAICLKKKSGNSDVNRHAHLSIDCPPKMKVGPKPGQVDKLDCEPDIKSVCGTDSDCPWDKICCHDGCWKNCTKPMLSRSSP